MAVQDHLKIAASELLRAVDALKQEISQLRSDEGNLRQLNTQQLAQVSAEIQILQQQQSQATDSSNSANIQQQIQLLNNQIGKKKKEIDDESKRITNMIRTKESEIAMIEAQAREISP